MKEAHERLQNNIQQSFSSFSDSMARQVDPDNWPFVTNPLFEVQGRHVRAATHVEFFAFSPLVDAAQRQEWETYSLDNQQWIQQNWDILLEEDTGAKHYHSAGYVAPQIYDQNHFTKPSEGAELYAPLWQTSPPPEDAIFINRNIFSFPDLEALYNDMTTYLDDVTHLSSVVSPVMTNLQRIYGFEQRGRNNNNNERSLQVQNEEVPRSVMFMPVTTNTLHSSHNGTTSDALVGFLQVVLNWQIYVQSLVPSGFVGDAVLGNDCGQSLFFTVGDASKEVIRQAMSPTSDSPSNGHTTVLGDLFSLKGTGHASCTYAFQLNPRDARTSEDNDVKSVPAIVLAFTAACFLAFFFVQYDKFVHARNEKLIKAATAIPSLASLLTNTQTQPSTDGFCAPGDDAEADEDTDTPLEAEMEHSKSYSEQIDVTEQEDTEEGEEEQPIQDIHVYPEGFQRSGCERLKSFLKYGEKELRNPRDSTPIADLFPECTVVFADIAGFTGKNYYERQAR